MSGVLIAIGFIVGSALLALAFFIIHRFVEGRAVLRALDISLLSVRVPYEPGKKEESPLNDLRQFSQFVSNLADPKIPFILELAVHNVGENIHFYLGVPRNSIESVSRNIQGLWPGAGVEIAEDYTVFNPSGETLIAYLRQARAAVLPIRTYEEVNLDTFAPILSAFSKLEAAGEGLAFQIIGLPAGKATRRKIMGALTLLKKGGKMGPRGVVPPPKGEKRDAVPGTYEPPVVNTQAVQLLEKKISKPLFYVNIRSIASAARKERADELLSGLLQTFTQFSSPLHNEFRVVRPSNAKKLIFRYIFRTFSGQQAMLLNTDEIASLFHFPTGAAQGVPRVLWKRGKEAEPPIELPKVGTLLGESVFRGERRPVYMTDDDRRRHVYSIGQTGTGKSTLMTNMIVSDIAAGKGVALIDPHGDLVENVLGLVPPGRIADVVLFDPGNLSRPIGLNMLENDPSRPEEKTFIINELQEIFNKLFAKETMGPMFEQYMRNALHLLMDARDPATLMEVPRVFTDPEFRQRKLEETRNPTVIDFWQKEAIKTGGEASLQNMTPYITSKFNNFIANDYIRPIIGQTTSSFRFRELMDERKIFLVNLSKGRIGELNTGLLGMIIVAKLLMAALARADTPQEKRTDFYLYIDEFQNFTTDSIAIILSEARKYRLNLVITHQFIAQLEEKIRDAVFGNVGSLVAFRVGAADAEFLEKQFEPVFTKSDFLNLDNFNAYVRLLLNGKTVQPFNIVTRPPAISDSARANQVRELSRNKYGRDRQAVEMDIMKRLRS